jgi:hypothetical protein
MRLRVGDRLRAIGPEVSTQKLATVTPVVPTLSNIPAIIIGGNEMTRLEVLRRTVELCDERLEADLASAEVLLVDLGGTPEEITAALGRNGYLRAMHCASRNEQIAEVAVWLSGDSDDTLH